MRTTSLSQLHSDIDERVSATRAKHPEWLCGPGCDRCCRRLAEVPQLTAAEWALLQEGLAALSADRLRKIARDVAALAEQAVRPIVCPLLEGSPGTCPVYAQRPVACRTYGFYVQRELGLYCDDIKAQVAAGIRDDVLWGNHDAIDHRLAEFGETRPLTEWFERSER